MVSGFVKPLTEIEIYKALIILIICLCTASTIALCAITDTSLAQELPIAQNSIMLGHLGAENLCIAKALINGRGFADPFCVQSGPTAWMPPLLPFVTAGLFLLTGNSTVLTVLLTLLLQNLSLIFCGFTVLTLAQQKQQLTLGFWAFIASLFVYFHAWFTITHDHWLILTFTTLLIRQLLGTTPKNATRRRLLQQGLTAGMAALASPILAFAWAGTLLLLLGRKALLSIALAGMVITPWILRNAIVFHELILVKSNPSFELYQSLVLEPKGLLTVQNAIQTHPWTGDGKARQEYITLGEMAFIKDKSQLAWQFAIHHPFIVLQKIHYRLLSALLVYVPFSLGLLYTGIPLLIQRFFHPIAFLSLLCLLTWGKWRTQPERTIMAFYLLFLLPYILVSYYERYALPLLGVKILLFVYAVASFRQILRSQPKKIVR